MVALVVVLMLAIVFSLDLFVRRWRARRNISLIPQPRQIPLPEWAALPLTRLRFPRGLFYGQGHTWAGLRADGRIRIGIDDFLNAAMGPIDQIQTVRTGTHIRRGGQLAELRQGGTSVWVRSPLSGRVQGANPDAAALVQKDPYDTGWLAEIEPDDLATELPALHLGQKIADWIETEALRFGRFLAGNGVDPATIRLQDGGTPVERRLAALGPDRVDDFTRRFLIYQEED